ncbi:MAG TPA: ElyC/SanA/YdcF family protein [Cyclobacteriaceae bacterium]|nr:ElyC/SanA/YdcF family protein [Cyclobacteriaceae bacterium]
MRKVWRVLYFSVLFFFLFLIAINVWIVKSTERNVYSKSELLPDKRVALVLGTSHRTVKGQPNPFFEKRMETAAHLYQQGKVVHFILSGDNRTPYYNEPMAMKRALVKRGVPEASITLDYAGLRTLDSIVRSKAIFGQEKIIIITQPFHSYRALFISHFYDIDAVAMVAAEPDFEETPSVRIREYFARAKAVLDLYVLRTSPRFLGQKEELIIQN